MKITYIHHSSFSVELDTCTLLFDYFKGDLPKFNKDKKLYVFSSHQHYDHFDPIIFSLEKEYENVTYILSDDITVNESKNTVFVKPNSRLKIDNLNIQTLESTDLGVAFIVSVDGKNIYHAGDLNWWHWEGELSDEENEQMGERYKKEINKIKNMNFDVAFIPLDSRQGVQYYLGFDTFMKNTNTKNAFPIHFWRTYRIIDMLKDSA
ncbi:MAG: MBL fold metallo-hydrolase, partial [Romboutsia sp.]|uniref:MBL fold metallo-hydrolase n=1 Tax=Romboutsia sp. TaxID=1965302 RepID=UPI003F40B01A